MPFRHLMLFFFQKGKERWTNRKENTLCAIYENGVCIMILPGLYITAVCIVLILPRLTISFIFLHHASKWTMIVIIHKHTHHVQIPQFVSHFTYFHFYVVACWNKKNLKKYLFTITRSLSSTCLACLFAFQIPRLLSFFLMSYCLIWHMSVHYMFK